MADVTLFRRRCRVVVDTIEVVPLEKDPSKALTVRFVVHKSLTPEPNKAEVHIFNLNPNNRAQLANKRVEPASLVAFANGGSGPIKTIARDIPVLIEAGYQEGSSCIFLGNLRSVQSVREGADIITSLSSGDGEASCANARINKSFRKGSSVKEILEAIALVLGVEEGNLADAVKQFKSSGAVDIFANGAVLSGNAAAEMTAICRSIGFTWSIQDGKLQLLPLREALKGEAILLTPETGLIDSPTVDNKGVLRARMLMAPDVFPGRLVTVKTFSYNGTFRVENTTHTGDTSGNEWFVDIEAKAYQ